jgi:hypothetical protein
MLDKGQDDDWFSSNFIRWLAVLAVIGSSGPFVGLSGFGKCGLKFCLGI